MNLLCRLFRHSVAGEIHFNVEVEAGQEIGFRVNAEQVYVQWGDGEKSEIKYVTEYFKHIYQDAGTFQVDIHGNNIIDLEAKRCNIVSLDVSKCGTLEFIDCSENRLTRLDLSKCKNLYELYCEQNQLRELKLEKYDKLCYLSCARNYLEEIELSGCRKLVSLMCNHNNLKYLDVSHCLKLATVNVRNNKMDSRAINQFLDTLAIRKSDENCFVMLRENISADYNRNIYQKKGWYEI